MRIILNIYIITATEHLFYIVTIIVDNLKKEYSKSIIKFCNMHLSAQAKKDY